MANAKTEKQQYRIVHPGEEFEIRFYPSTTLATVYSSDKAIKRFSEKLRTSLEKEGINFYGNFRYLGYNPPYQFFGRRNEIIVSVNWSEN